MPELGPINTTGKTQTGGQVLRSSSIRAPERMTYEDMLRALGEPIDINALLSVVRTEAIRNEQACNVAIKVLGGKEKELATVFSLLLNENTPLLQSSASLGIRNMCCFPPKHPEAVFENTIAMDGIRQFLSKGLSDPNSTWLTVAQVLSSHDPVAARDLIGPALRNIVNQAGDDEVRTWALAVQLSCAKEELAQHVSAAIKSGDPKLIHEVLENFKPMIVQDIADDAAPAIVSSLSHFALNQNLSADETKIVLSWLEEIKDRFQLGSRDVWDALKGQVAEVTKRLEERLNLMALSAHLSPERKDSNIWSLLKKLDEELTTVESSKSADYTGCQQLFERLVALDEDGIKSLARMFRTDRREVGSAIGSRAPTWTWVATALADTPMGLRYLGQTVDECVYHLSLSRGPALCWGDYLEQLGCIFNAVTSRKDRAKDIVPNLQAIMTLDNNVPGEVLHEAASRAIQAITGSGKTETTSACPATLASDPVPTQVHRSNFVGMKVFRSVNRDPNSLKRAFEGWLATKPGYEIIQVNSPGDTNWVSVTYKAPAGSPVDDGKELRF